MFWVELKQYLFIFVYICFNFVLIGLSEPDFGWEGLFNLLKKSGLLIGEVSKPSGGGH